MYVRAWTLCCFDSTQTFQRAMTVSVDSCAEIKSAPKFSGVTNSGSVWKKVPDSDAGSVRVWSESVLCHASSLCSLLQSG